MEFYNIRARIASAIDAVVAILASDAAFAPAHADFVTSPISSTAAAAAFVVAAAAVAAAAALVSAWTAAALVATASVVVAAAPAAAAAAAAALVVVVAAMLLLLLLLLLSLLLHLATSVWSLWWRQIYFRYFNYHINYPSIQSYIWNFTMFPPWTAVTNIAPRWRHRRLTLNIPRYFYQRQLPRGYFNLCYYLPISSEGKHMGYV